MMNRYVLKQHKIAMLNIFKIHSDTTIHIGRHATTREGLDAICIVGVSMSSDYPTEGSLSLTLHAPGVGNSQHR